MLDCKEFRSIFKIKKYNIKQSNHYNKLRKEIIKEIISKHNPSRAFYLIDLATIYRKYLHWKKVFPNIIPFYAIKCNPDPIILSLLSSLNIGFDCASIFEISSILELGNPCNHIIHANPKRSLRELIYAKNNDINLLTFDSLEELYKIKKYHSKSLLLLRIKTYNDNAVINLNIKFGAKTEEIIELLTTGMKLGLNIIGVSFHVGSNCNNPYAYKKAILLSLEVFKSAKSLGMTPFTILDIGGGFKGGLPIESPLSFSSSIQSIADLINPLINFSFPKNIKVIAEPGRYFVEASHTLLVKIISKKICRSKDKAKINYVINESVYSSFKDSVLLNLTFIPSIIYMEDVINSSLEFDCSFYGNSGNQSDCIAKNVKMKELKVNSWVGFTSMGAYTTSVASLLSDKYMFDKRYVWIDE